MPGSQLAIGLALGLLIAVLARRLETLTRRGAFGAALIGALTFGWGGLLPALLLIAFFASASGLSRLGARRKRGLMAVYAKGTRRDLGQVLANGGLATLLAVGYGVRDETLLLAGLAGALAAVNADTWATELGVLARGWPRLITTGERVPPGTSGGVTLEGFLAAAAGAGLLGSLSGAWTGSATLLLAVSIGGVVGAAFDSLLGASLQSVYHCPNCGHETEHHPVHSCGSHTRQIRGWRWLGNDLVNFSASVAGGGLSALLWAVLG